MDIDAFLQSEFDEHMAVAGATLAAVREPFKRLLDRCEICIRANGKILFFGNGGSAADAQNLATELSVRYVKDRPAIAALALTTDSSVLTAAGNDLGFLALAQPGGRHSVAVRSIVHCRHPSPSAGTEPGGRTRHHWVGEAGPCRHQTQRGPPNGTPRLP